MWNDDSTLPWAHKIFALLIAVHFLFGVSETFAQCEVREDAKLTAPDAAPGDVFGASVSVSGDVAFVGAYLDACAAGQNCGSVYVYQFNGSAWVVQTKLTASDAAPGDYFGISVSVNGSVAVVGAFGGSAYAYRLPQIALCRFSLPRRRSGFGSY